VLDFTVLDFTVLGCTVLDFTVLGCTVLGVAADDFFRGVCAMKPVS
jgi:hypothetical protein